MSRTKVEAIRDDHCFTSLLYPDCHLHLSTCHILGVCQNRAKPIYPTIAVYSVGKGRRPSIPPTSLTFASLLLIPFKEKLIAQLIPALVAERQS